MAMEGVGMSWGSRPSQPLPPVVGSGMTTWRQRRQVAGATPFRYSGEFAVPSLVHPRHDYPLLSPLQTTN